MDREDIREAEEQIFSPRTRRDEVELREEEIVEHVEALFGPEAVGRAPGTGGEGSGAEEVQESEGGEGERSLEEIERDLFGGRGP